MFFVHSNQREHERVAFPKGHKLGIEPQTTCLRVKLNETLLELFKIKMINPKVFGRKTWYVQAQVELRQFFSVCESGLDNSQKWAHCDIVRWPPTPPGEFRKACNVTFNTLLRKKKKSSVS